MREAVGCVHLSLGGQHLMREAVGCVHLLLALARAGTRREIESRRAAALPPAWHRSGGLTIGMHIRGGDSCHMRRYCPSNLTSTYFAVSRAYDANNPGAHPAREPIPRAHPVPASAAGSLDGHRGSRVVDPESWIRWEGGCAHHQSERRAPPLPPLIPTAHPPLIPTAQPH